MAVKESARPAQKESIRLLLADDHQVVCEALTSLLEEHDDLIVVGTASNGVEALKRAEALTPDIVIMDISMPGMDGLQAIEQLKVQSPELSSIILSMHADPEHVYKALQAGSRGYVLKDCAGRELERAIRAVHAGHLYLTHSLTGKVIEDYLRLKNHQPPNNAIDKLSARELEVLKLQAEGTSTLDIAKALHLSPKTVETYRYRLKEKLNIRDTAGLVKLAIREGLVSLEP